MDRIPCRLLVILSAACLATLGVAASTCLAWDKDAAQDYGLTWGGSSRSSNFPDYSSDCANFVSQCLHAHNHRDVVDHDPILGYLSTADKAELNSTGVDMYFAGGTGESNGWYCLRYSGDNTNTISTKWVGANAFHYYMRDNAHFDPYRSLLGTYDFDSSTSTPSPPLNQSDMTHSDIISYMWNQNSQEEFYANHVAFVVRDNAHSRFSYPDLMSNDNYQGDLISSHTGNRDQIDWTYKDVFMWAGSPEYDQSHRADWKLAAWRLSSSLD